MRHLPLVAMHCTLAGRSIHALRWHWVTVRSHGVHVGPVRLLLLLGLLLAVGLGL